MGKSQNAQIMEDNWLIQFGNEGHHWNSNCENWPSVVASKYCELRTFCQENDPYGASWSLRDNFETLLKLETLLAYAWAEKHTSEDFKFSTICLLTTKDPSFGLWMELAKRLINSLQGEKINLPEEIPLETLRKEYAKRDVVGWRNAKIGHGVLEQEKDEDFRVDLLKMMREYSQIIDKIESELSQQQMFVDNDTLIGPSMARGLSVKGKVQCRLLKSEEVFSLDPFILIRKHEKKGTGVYFFDNQKTRTLTVYQAYAEGSSFRESNDYFLKLRKMLDSQGIHLDADPMDEYLSANEHWEAERIHMEEDFVKPTHLLSRLTSCLDEYDRGSFLLQMERGTGKSAFSDKLDGLHPDPLQIGDVEIRTYHITRSQMMGNNDIESRIEWLWSVYYEGGGWQYSRRISDYEQAGMDKAEAISSFLRDTLRFIRRNKNKNKLLMVFDGIDEIADEKIWDLFPNPDQLPEGVYLMYTSRYQNEETISDENSNRLGQLKESKIIETIDVDRFSKDHVAFLKKYIHAAEKKKGFSLNDQEKEALLILSDYRTIYLSLYCTLLNQGITIDKLPDASSVVEYYLNLIEKRYSENERIHLREILSLISVLGEYEPLTLGEIGALTSETRVTLKLIGMMRDLSPILKVSRSPEGNRFSVVNPDIAGRLADSIPETIDTIEDVVTLSVAQLRQGYPIELKDTEVAAAHVCELLQLVPNRTEDGLEDVLDQFVQQGQSAFESYGQLRRFIDFRRQELIYCKQAYGVHERTLYAMEAYSDMLITNGKYQEAVLSLGEALELSARLDNSQRLYTVDVLILLALYHKTMMNLELMEECLNGITKLIKQNHSDGETVKYTRIMIYYSLLAYNKLSSGDVSGAVEDYRFALDMFKKHKGEEDPETLICMNEYGLALWTQKKYQKALKIQQRTLELDRKVLGNNHPETLTAMNNLAVTLSDMGWNEEARDLNAEILELRKALLGPNHPQTLISAFNLASVERELDHIDEARYLFEDTWKKQREVLGEESIDTLKSLYEYIMCYCRLGKYDIAEKMILEHLPMFDRVLGEKHELSEQLVMSLLQIYYEQNERSKADKYLRRMRII